MGFRDRDYMRERPPLAARGRVVLWLIGATAAAFLVQILMRPDVVRVFGIVPEHVFARLRLWQLVTHAFLHADVWHLFWNMLFLWLLGTDIAEIYGARRFLMLYFGGAIAGALGHTVAGYAAGQPGIPAIGASGAVMSVAVVAALFYPNRPVWIGFILELPLWLVVTAYVAFDAYALLAGNRPGIAVAAHLAGAAFGFAFHRFGLDGWLVALWRAIPRVRFTSRPPPEEVDRILDKINREGIGSLTDEERATLKRASR